MVHQIGQPSRNDPGRREGWQERAVRGIDKETLRKLTVNTSDDFVSLLKKCAQKRDISQAAYMRRALAAFVAYDLQIPFEDVCQMHPKAIPNEWRFARPLVKELDDGEGFGEWRIQKVV